MSLTLVDGNVTHGQNHPKAVAAAEAARLKAAKKAHEKETIRQAMKDHSIEFITVGAYTIAFRVDRRNVIEISTAIRHPGDAPDKHMGRVVALARFMANNRVLLRVPGVQEDPILGIKYRVTVRKFLNDTFTNYGDLA